MADMTVALLTLRSGRWLAGPQRSRTVASNYFVQVIHPWHWWRRPFPLQRVVRDDGCFLICRHNFQRGFHSSPNFRICRENGTHVILLYLAREMGAFPKGTLTNILLIWGNLGLRGILCFGYDWCCNLNLGRISFTWA